MLATLLLGGLAVGALTVVATALPGQPAVQTAAAVLGSALIVFALAGPVYGSFATVADMFTLLYLVGQALVYAAEVAAVRYARLWPRALDLNHPTAAGARALTLLAREQERVPAARVQFHLAAPHSPPEPADSPPDSDDLK